MAKVKAIFKNITDEDKQRFKKSSCMLTISVGQEYHEGERFAATAELIKANFDFCIILLYDSLQRYTMALNYNAPVEKLHKIAAKEGELWIERNNDYIEIINPKKIYHWDDWLNHPLFTEQKNKILALIERDLFYKNTFDVSINKYLDRYCKNLLNTADFDMDRAKELCFEYVLEECAVFPLWTELNCEYEIYPNFHNEAIQETRKRFVFENNPHLLNPLMFSIINAKQLKPQKFYGLNDLQKQLTG